MFDQFKAMGAVANLLKNKDKLQEAGARVKEKMSRTEVVGEAGSGAARATVTGAMRVVSVELSPTLVSGMAADDRTRQLAASLIAEAVNDALAKAQARLRDEISRESAALGLPDLNELPGIGEMLR